MRADLLEPALRTVDQPGLWRFRRWLPLDGGPVSYPLVVGGTPLLAPARLRERLGLPDLYLKDETRGPTASNKDRATAMVLEQALRAGIDTVTCASTGNVAVSTAVGAAAAGIRAVVFVPATVNPSKLQLMLFAGATVVRVRKGYETAFQLSREAAAKRGWADRNTGVNPATTAAKTTVWLEVFEQLGGRSPDVCVVPFGDGPTLVSTAQAFQQLLEAGLIQRLPRILGVRAADPAATIADGIAVTAPVLGREARAAVAESRGDWLDVTDREMLLAMKVLAQDAGLLVEPAGAASFAGLTSALAKRIVDRKASIVTLVTGSALKTPEHVRPDAKPLTIEGTLDELPAELD